MNCDLRLIEATVREAQFICTLIIIKSNFDNSIERMSKSRKIFLIFHLSHCVSIAAAHHCHDPIRKEDVMTQSYSILVTISTIAVRKMLNKETKMWLTLYKHSPLNQSIQ